MGFWNRPLGTALKRIDDNTHTLVAAAAARGNINFREKLPQGLEAGMVPHLLGLIAELDVDPTFTTAPTQLGLAAAINRLTLRGEKGRVVFDGSGMDLRALELYENGGMPLSPDGDLNGGSTTNFYAARMLSFGPGGFVGNPSDFAIPVPLLSEAALDLMYGALTDISADTTAGTVRSLVHGIAAGLPEVRIPPKTEVKVIPAAGNSLELGERALYCSLLLLNSTAHDAIAAGDFGAFTLDARFGNVFTGIDAENLGRAYNVLMGQGQFGFIQGEPRAATDDNLKVANGASPTAIASPTAAYQPIIFNGGGARISKLNVEGPLKLTWNGTQATASAIVRRILPRSAEEAKELAVQVFESMKLPYKDGHIKTISKRPYVGPAAEYMPWVFKYETKR